MRLRWLPLMLILAVEPVAAHELRARALGSTTIEFRFDDGTPMAFAAGRIFGPGDTIPAIEATTDRLGRLSFVPDRDGQWRAEAGDADGHKLSVAMSIANGVPAGSGRGLPDWVVAISLVANIALIARLVGRRKSR